MLEMKVISFETVRSEGIIKIVRMDNLQKSILINKKLRFSSKATVASSLKEPLRLCSFYQVETSAKVINSLKH